MRVLKLKEEDGGDHDDDDCAAGTEQVASSIGRKATGFSALVVGI